MKKHMIILLAIASVFALALCLAGCGKSGAPEPATTDNGTANTSANMANPWAEYDSADAAAKAAGVGTFKTPVGTEGRLGKIDPAWAKYRAMDGVAEVQFPAGAYEMQARKGLASAATDGDISGDYNTYKAQWTAKVGSTDVKCFGQADGAARKVIWTSGDYCYSLVVAPSGDADDLGLNAEDVAFFVNNIK